MPDRRPLMFAYWGRRGGVCRFTFNLAEAVANRNDASTTISISRSNEIFNEFLPFERFIFPVSTFTSTLGAITQVAPLMRLRRDLAARFAADRTVAIVSLLSHVWSPLIAPVIRRARVRHIVVVHDVDAHMGDPSGIAHSWRLLEARTADHIVALSHAVAERLALANRIPKEKITVLFHPDLDYGKPVDDSAPQGAALRVLFLGRILAYKGLGLFVEAVEILRRQGVAIEASVFGAGDLGEYAGRLAALGAEVKNRWISDHEFKAILARHDAAVLTHVKASQSGVVSAAFGAGLPVVVTPVGGLIEQVDPDVTGIVADGVSAEAIARAIRRLADDRALLHRLRRGVAATAQSRSMERFFDSITAVALG